jgi:hypothetical protein
MIAQAIRAILLATATATSLAGFFQQPHDPGMLLRMLPGVSNNSCCTDDEQPSEIAISLLGDAAEPLLAARRMLPRHKSDPCRKIPTGFEVTRVCDSRSNGRGPDHANPGHGLEAAAHVIGTMMGVNGAIQGPDLRPPSGDSLLNNHPLAHSMPGAGVVHHINRVILATPPHFRVFPNKRAMQGAVACLKGAACHNPTSRLSTSVEAQQLLGIRPADLEAITRANRHALEPV